MSQGFTEPSNDDNILEVVAVLGATQMVRKVSVLLALLLKSKFPCVLTEPAVSFVGQLCWLATLLLASSLSKCAQKWYKENLEWISPLSYNSNN